MEDEPVAKRKRTGEEGERMDLGSLPAAVAAVSKQQVRILARTLKLSARHPRSRETRNGPPRTLRYFLSDAPLSSTSRPRRRRAHPTQTKSSKTRAHPPRLILRRRRKRAAPGQQRYERLHRNRPRCPGEPAPSPLPSPPQKKIFRSSSTSPDPLSGSSALLPQVATRGSSTGRRGS